VTTGPSSIDPKTGKRYGLSFPIVTIPDFVRVQRALVDSLGIQKLHAVVGPSMGGLMAYEWAAAFPERLQRIVPVSATPMQGAYACVQLDLWSAAVRLDPNWKGGDYYDGPPPNEGVALSLYSILSTARHAEWAAATFGRALTRTDRNPLEHLDATWMAQSALMDVARARAPIVDANHMLYMTRANQLFMEGFATSVDVGLKKIRADALVVASRTDLLFPPHDTRKVVETLRANGAKARYLELDSGGGHYAGIVDVAQASGEIASFLGE
jgi:homoserine O-acetyltransferase